MKLYRIERANYIALNIRITNNLQINANTCAHIAGII